MTIKLGSLFKLHLFKKSRVIFSIFSLLVPASKIYPKFKFKQNFIPNSSTRKRLLDFSISFQINTLQFSKINKKSKHVLYSLGNRLWRQFIENLRKFLSFRSWWLIFKLLILKSVWIRQIQCTIYRLLKCTFICVYRSCSGNCKNAL